MPEETFANFFESKHPQILRNEQRRQWGQVPRLGAWHLKDIRARLPWLQKATGQTLEVLDFAKKYLVLLSWG